MEGAALVGAAPSNNFAKQMKQSDTSGVGWSILLDQHPG